jgi:putative flippase GtrA
MDWIPWVVRAILITVGIVLGIVVWKEKEEGKHQEYSLRFFVIGTTAFAMGAILLTVSSMTDLSFDYDLFLTAAGAIGIIIGLAIRNIWEKKR